MELGSVFYVRYSALLFCGFELTDLGRPTGFLPPRNGLVGTGRGVVPPLLWSISLFSTFYMSETHGEDILLPRSNLLYWIYFWKDFSPSRWNTMHISIDSCTDKYDNGNLIGIKYEQVASFLVYKSISTTFKANTIRRPRHRYYET